MEGSGFSTPPTKEDPPPINGERDVADSAPKRDYSIRASPSSAMPPRSSTLSWQRRPNSQSSDLSRSRPLSMVATENAARSPKATPTPEPSSASTSEQSLSREQIAQSLASKDPAWFRQTADRGLHSPAYRRNQVEDEDRSDHGSYTARVQMPGMSREVSESEKTQNPPIDGSSTPRRNSATPSFGIGSKSPQTNSLGGLGTPIPLSSAQKLDPPNTDSMSETRGLAMSPSQGRISPERSDRPTTSPTKGMGGFVQSAMMKRSDSVSKRWSVQSPVGLSRRNSVASNRNSNDAKVPIGFGSVVNASASASRPSSLSRDNSPRPSSRPTSSQSNATITTSGSMRRNTTTSTNSDAFVKPSLPSSRSQIPSDVKAGQENAPGDQSSRNETTPPITPSKTMDPRRWSPTKSSWLESALNKPESPKPKVAPQQPAWMSEISKIRKKNSVDLTHDPTVGHKHEVNIGGLMRSPAPGGLAGPSSIAGLPAGGSSGAISKDHSESVSSPESELTPSKPDVAEHTSPTPTPEIESSPANSKPKVDRPKPETPPKKDFRAILKPRQLPADNDGKEEPEFKSVFGQLRRTKTQNYVAPDELKDNIARGKAALNSTGGPKKSEPRDEFKDAILKKKEDFRKAQLEGKGVPRPTTRGGTEAPLPEALAKRQTLGRSNSTVNETDIREFSSSAFPPKESSASGRLQGKEAIGGKLAGRLNPALAGLLARGPPSIASDTSRSSSPTSSSQRTVSMSTATTNPETPETGPQLTHMTKGRARGPRRKAPSKVSAAAITSKGASDANSPLGSKPESPIRSRVSVPVKTLESTEPVLETSSQANIENPVTEHSTPRKLDMKSRSQFLHEAANKSNEGEPLLDSSKPSPAKINTRETPAKLEQKEPEQTTKSTDWAKPIPPTKSSSLMSRDTERSPNNKPLPLLPRTSNTTEMSPEATPPLQSRTLASWNGTNQSENSKSGGQGSLGSVKNVAALWDRPSASQPAANPPRARSPIKLPTQDDEKAAMIDAGLRSPSPVKSNAPIGLGIQSIGDLASARPLPTPPVKHPRSPSPNARPAPSVSRMESDLPPLPRASEASKLLSDFFVRHDSPPEFLADTAAILAARPEQGTDVKTLRASLYQFSGDGKKQPVPTHQERLLFEGNMYICVHVFGNVTGKKVTEVYFWAGDEVPASVVEGADIFAQREAKSAGGRLVKIQQGKETPEFFQALGGIIIIRRGTSNKYDSLAPHILCGRKQFGQIAFDEVDYSPASLCSGFPYLISTQSGKCYLWKGKGSGVDELSCARLIGMDFGLTGDIEEVEDGSEPASFLEVFGDGAQIPKSADHWRLKPNYNKYCGRLFCAYSSAKSQVSKRSTTQSTQS